jgi:hypothetical protein
MSDEMVPALPGMDGALNPVDEAQLRADEARRAFEAAEGSAPWMDDYWDLIGEGWPWRQAVYMVWACQPKDQRQPSTQRDLATQVLGLASDRQIREWRAKNPALDTRVAKLTASALSKARAEIYRALIEAASKPDPRAHQDRKLALELMGDYIPNSEMNLRVGELAISSDEMAAARKELEAWEQEQDEGDGNGNAGRAEG